jgi:hypothetical protein
MSSSSSDSELRGLRWWMRAVIAVGIPCAAFVLRGVEPTTLSWLPLRTSCGALTGLPCIFCGTTRALHHLLNGNFGQAIYFNWLAFPVVAVAGFCWAKSAAELILSRSLRPVFPGIHFTRRTGFICVLLLAGLWMFQVSLALAFHKHELLNPNGLLYALLVR